METRNNYIITMSTVSTPCIPGTVPGTFARRPLPFLPSSSQCRCVCPHFRDENVEAQRHHSGQRQSQDSHPDPSPVLVRLRVAQIRLQAGRLRRGPLGLAWQAITLPPGTFSPKMSASAANGVGSGHTVSPRQPDGMGFSEGTGKAPGERSVLASSPLGARPRDHQGM